MSFKEITGRRFRIFSNWTPDFNTKEANVEFSVIGSYFWKIVWSLSGKSSIILMQYIYRRKKGFENCW